MESSTLDEARGEGADPLADLARKAFKVDYLFPLQRFVVANVLDAAAWPGNRDGGAALPVRAEAGVEEGDEPVSDAQDKRDGEGLRQVALLPTGFGKSLCFQLPALALPGPTIAVYPLLALMADQQRRLESLGIPCALFKGGQTANERKAAMEAVAAGRAKIVITNPESLRGGLLDFLAQTGPSHVAIDEAHCVSEWGETFRPAYLELGKALERLAPAATTAFTATAGGLVLESMSRILFGGRPFLLVEGDPDRPNIAYEVQRSLARERRLEAILRSCEKPAIVFASSRAGVEILAERLRRRLGSDAVRFYHAGLEPEEKQAAEAWFFTSADGVLVSTCAYGMGLDKRDIRTVVHWDPPPSIEAYLQESGRAGRDGRPARAILVMGPGAARVLEREEDPVRRSRRAALLDYAADDTRCRRAALLALLGSRLESPCSGCDVCGGRTAPGYEGAAEIERFARLNPRRHVLEDATRLLLGTEVEPPAQGASGSLAGWRPEDVAAAILAAAREGLVRIPPRGPWKGRLAPARGPGGPKGLLFLRPASRP